MNFLRFNWNFTEHNELLFSENTIKGFSRNLIKCNQLHCMKIFKKNSKKFVCNIISTKTFIVAIKTGPQHKFLIASIQNIVLRLLWLHIKCLTANNFVSVCVLLIFHWNQQKFMTKIHEKNGFKGEREWGKKNANRTGIYCRNMLIEAVRVQSPCWTIFVYWIIRANTTSNVASFEMFTC